MKVHYSSKSNEWATPQCFYDRLEREFNFTLDPCSDGENAKCERFFTIEDDGLSQSWEGETVFMNPPYSREIPKWIEKAYLSSLLEGATVVCLIPSRTDTRYWHDFIFPGADEIRFIKGRLKFGDGSNSAPFPSALVIFRPGSDGPPNMTTMQAYE